VLIVAIAAILASGAGVRRAGSEAGGLALWGLSLDPASAAARAEVEEAFGRILRTVDPCGDSREVAAILGQLRACAGRYLIRTSTTASRNLFDRPSGTQADTLPRTITWNPRLRSELEPVCNGDPLRPVARDPTASLLHELVHAAQDCRGLNPGEHEVEAVRIENVYRRAAGLCQRARYGDDPLPTRAIKTCAALQLRAG
jgi:hypothetical protein